MADPAESARDQIRHSGSLGGVLQTAFPLIMAASTHAVRLFTDRVMLSYYSSDALSASLSAGITYFSLSSIIMGTVHYTSTFVAQYSGARQTGRVGASVWQGIYVAILGGGALSLLSFAATPIFKWFGHAPSLQLEQAAYFRVLTVFAVFPLVNSALLGFWSGRGKTWTVFAISLVGVVLNVILNALLIYGLFGFPRMGILGAAIATSISSMASMAFALYLFWTPENCGRYGTWPKVTFDRELFLRLLRFGFPSGVNMFLDVAAFNAFVMLLGQRGTDVAAATSVAFSMNAMAFIPMIGIGFTVNILVGQGIGRCDIPFARRCVRNARLLTLIYMGTLTLLFLSFPTLFVDLFKVDAGARDLAISFLRYIAVYLVFDGIFIVYQSAIKGAGDTHFSMWIAVVISWFFMVLPCWYMVQAGWSVWRMWLCFVLYVMLAAAVFYGRYRGGAWESMSVIDQRR